MHPCVLQHGGADTTASCSTNGNPYNPNYSLGRGIAGDIFSVPAPLAATAHTSAPTDLITW